MDEEFNFSSNYVAAFKNNKLIVEENKNSIKNYYGENVNNVVLFLGQNGIGKSTILDVLGMNRNDRSNDTYSRKRDSRIIKHSYFLMYHLYDDYFAFEFIDDSFLKGDEKIENIDMQSASVKEALYRLPMGNIFKLKDKIFLYCDNIILTWRENNDIRNKIEYAYITSDRYNNRISNKYREHYEEYIFERKYYLESANYEFLYKYFIYLKDIKNELLEEKSIFISNNIKNEIDFYSKKNEIQDFLMERKYELDKLFHIKSEIKIGINKKVLQIEERDKRSRKYIFLHDFYAEAIEYYFLEQFVGWSGSKGINIDINIPVPTIESSEIFVESLIKIENREVYENGMMNISNFQEEYGYLLYQIKKNTDADGNVKLKSVLEYVLNRVQFAASGIVDVYDKKAVLQIVTLLEELSEEYFESKKTIKLKCNLDRPDEKVVELLKWYDNYYKIRNDEYGSNRISEILHIELSKMSEGQRVFLDIISKCVSAIYDTIPGDSIVLLIDEPDRALHPELARRFLDSLLNSINYCKDRNVQVILTSHSPFIVTDILPENVYIVEIKDGMRQIRHNSNTYATNIYYLLMDSFMLENTFGQYSYKKIEKIVEILNGKQEISSEQSQQMKKIIDRIGEKTVKKKLIELYDKRNDYKSTLITRLLNETDEEKIRKIKDILDSND